MHRVSEDSWGSGDAYESYVGRWSRLVAREFVTWLDVPAGSRWLDVGCGTGVLTEAALALASPARVTGVEPSTPFREYAAAHVTDPRASFVPGDASSLPVADASCDAVASALVLNFVPYPGAALTEMCRAAHVGGVVASYVWDYASGMQMIRHLWDAAAELDPAARIADEGLRFGSFHAGRLRELYADAGLRDVSVEAIVVPTMFDDFDDFWTPFLGGVGPAPAYAGSLTEAQRRALREAVLARLPIENDGSIRLTARAWAVRGSR